MSNLHNHETLEGVGHEGRATTVVCALNVGSNYDNHVPLADLVKQLTTLLESIPAEQRATARLNIKAYGDYASAYVDVTYLRPETDEEMNARHAWLAGLNREDEARDRHEFDRLKRKFVDGEDAT